MYLQNKNAGNKFRQPEGLVLCHPIKLTECLLRACNSVLSPLLQLLHFVTPLLAYKGRILPRFRLSSYSFFVCVGQHPPGGRGEQKRHLGDAS
jgi:hypothetical protein